jgi:hypothetical protein
MSNILLKRKSNKYKVSKPFFVKEVTMQIYTFKKTEKILKEFSQNFNGRNQHLNEDINNKVSYLAKDKFPNRSKHFKDISSKNNEAKAILKLFYDMLNLTRSNIFYNEKSRYLPKKRSNHKINIKAPIGILGFNYLNALLQFMINIDSIKNMFQFTPKSFFYFNLFFETYEIEKKNQMDLLSLRSDYILNCLLNKFDEKHFILNKGKIDLYKILSLIMNVFFIDNQINFDFLMHQNSDFLSFKPNWQIIFDIQKNISLENYIFEVLKKSMILPKELLISFKWFDSDKRFYLNQISMPKIKFMFFYNNFKSIYELDSFIEYREDSSNFGSYITYVKIDNIWYQTEDEKVCVIKENNLSIALSRSILFHYKYRNNNASIYI